MDIFLSRRGNKNKKIITIYCSYGYGSKPADGNIGLLVNMVNFGRPYKVLHRAVFGLITILKRRLSGL